MKSGKLGIGIIGTGSIAQLAHIPGYQAISDQCEIVAAADVSEDALASAQRDFGIPHLFRDYHELLQLDEVDAVSVCASNPIHHPAHLGGAGGRQARVLREAAGAECRRRARDGRRGPSG